MRSFYGGILHVCYAPEYETVDDTREKLHERRRVVARKCRGKFYDTVSSFSFICLLAVESSKSKILIVNLMPCFVTLSTR